MSQKFSRITAPLQTPGYKPNRLHVEVEAVAVSKPTSDEELLCFLGFVLLMACLIGAAQYTEP